MPPSNAIEALSFRFLDIHSASSGIDEGTDYNFILFRLAIVNSNRVMSKILSYRLECI